MSELARAGIGVVLVTHHVEEIVPEIDRVIMLKDGRVFGDGPKTTILTSERLSDLFGIDLRVDRRGEHYHLTRSPR
jgi:iron complex transport system ATP-binding protein